MRFLCRRGRNQDLAATYESRRNATYESRRNSDAAPWRSSGYGELAELFFTVAIKSGGKRQETWHAEDEILYLLDGNSRVDVLPMAISVDRKGTIAAPSCALASTHSWPWACLVRSAVYGSGSHTKLLATKRQACGRDTALRTAH
jgi:hypothetical protein